MMVNKAPLQTCTEQIKKISSGTHACYFYYTMEDLLDILIPYFAEGLANDEFCLWVCPDLIPAEKARSIFLERLPLPHPKKYFRKGQLKILDAGQWYIDPETLRFRPEIAVKHAGALYTEVIKKGFSGFRCSGDISWLPDESWTAFMDYEQYVNQVVSTTEIRAICSYPISRCGPPEIIDVVSRHQSSLLRTRSGWKLCDHTEHAPHAGTRQPSNVPDERLSRFSHRVHSAIEDERKKISMRLHTDIGSLSLGLSSRLSDIEEGIKNKNLEDARKNLSETQAALKSEVLNIKQLAHSIRPPELDFGGFCQAVESCFPDLARKQNIDFRFHYDRSRRELSEREATLLYRIAQEAFNNGLKHSGAKTLEMSLERRKGRLCLCIRDDGRGFDSRQASNHSDSSFGLYSMKSMAETLGGTFRVQSSPGKGTNIEVLFR